jgi:nuclear pore complex protein Nup160
MTHRYDIAHSALFLIHDHAIQLSSLRTLVISMCEQSSAAQLLDLPFIGLQDEVDEILAQKCQSIQDVTIGVPFHKILYAWRIRHSDFRGAASVSLERLQRLQTSSVGNNIPSCDLDDGEDELETPVTKQYLTLINALSCVDPKQAWVLAEPVTKKNGVVEKRKVVTLEEARRGYQDELDRIERVQMGRFAFVGGEEVEMGGV